MINRKELDDWLDERIFYVEKALEEMKKKSYNIEIIENYQGELYAYNRVKKTLWYLDTTIGEK